MQAGRFTKIILYFFRVDSYAECNVMITGKEVSLGDGGGMQGPCLLEITDTKNILEILKNELCKNI